MEKFSYVNFQSRIVLAPTREHGAISPLQWSHTGDGVRPDQVCQAIRVYEESDGVRMNAKDLDRMNAYLDLGIDFELNRALSDMFVD